MLALVTGASAGFGYSISKKLIELGYKVIGCGRRAEKLEELKQELGEKFYPLVFDMTDTVENINKLFKELPNEFQIDQIDLLVNNAGLALGLEPADKAELDDWYTMIDTNVKGLVTVTRLILPSMVQKKSGLIINMGSIAGTYPYPGGNVYGATKAFVEQFSLNLRADLAGTGVRVTNIEPGLENMPIGVKVTLRGNKMYEFLDRLMTVSLPRVRDFKGVSDKGFDPKG